MKRLSLSVLLSLVLAPAAFAASSVYVNNGIISSVYPPQPNPAIDAITFINRGYFAVTNLTFAGLFAPALPYETSNTRNFTNYNQMLGDTGFRFVNNNTVTGRRTPADNFANGVNVADTNASIFGTYYLLVQATNIVNRGTLSIGGPGLMSLDGDNLNLARGKFNAIAEPGIIDNFWGFATNTLGGFFNASLIASSPMLVQTIFDQFYFYQFFQTVLDSGYTAHVDIVPLTPTFQYVDVLFLANTNPLITTEVRFDERFFGGDAKFIQWKSVLTNRATGSLTTNYLYLADTMPYYDTVPLLQTANGGNFFYFGTTAATYRPANFDLFRDFPAFNAYTLEDPVQFNPALLQGTNFPVFVTNSGYGATITAEAFRPDPYVAGSTYSNVPGRIEITARKALDLTRARIDGQSYLKLTATNHFIGSTNAEITSPVTDLNLKTTNRTLTLANIVSPTVPRMNGTIECWSGTWTNTDASGVTSLYHVTVINSQLNTEQPAKIDNLRISAADLVLSDVFNIIDKLFIDSRSLTITSNGPAAPNAVGELNLNSGELFWSVNFPNLQTITNYGRITASNSLYFGGTRTAPWTATSYEEPYLAFINHGFISSQGNDTWANYYVSSGTNLSGVGPLSVRAGQAFITNGTFVSDAADISITANTLLLSNQVMNAARSITLSPASVLDDGSLTTSVALVTNKNVWQVGDGIRLMTLPAQGTLLATTVTNTAQPYANVLNYWASADLRCTAAGFANNSAIGRMILDAGSNSVYTFSSPSGGNSAIYIDYLELRGYANTRDASGNFVALNIDPNMTVYFGTAVSEDGTIVAEKLSGANGGRLCWVSSYNTGFFSSTNILFPDGVVRSVNLAVALSCDLDSDNDGIVNCLDPSPVLPGDAGQVTTGGGSQPPGNTGGGTTTPAGLQLTYPGNLAPVGAPSQTFSQVKGTYRGLFYDTNNVTSSSSGYIVLTSTGSSYSGRLQMGAKNYYFTGRFNAAGLSVKSVARTGLAPVILNLQLDLAGGGRIVGTASERGGWTSSLIANLATYNALTRPFPYKGTYNVVLPPAEAPAHTPSGFSFGTASVGTSGSVVLTLNLADTSKLSHQSAVSRQGVFPVYAVPSTGRGVVMGWVEVNANEVEGQVIWVKPAKAGVAYYPGGFTNRAEVIGARYNAPQTGARVINLSNGVGQLIFAGESVAAPVTRNIYIDNNNQITSSDGQVSMSVSKLTGWFYGSVVNPETGKPLPFQGRMLQDNNFGAGFTWTTNKVGSVLLSPAP